MKTRDIVFVLIVVGIIIGALFIIPIGGLGDITTPTMVCDIRVNSSFHYDALMGSTIKFTEATAYNWREARLIGLTIGEALLEQLYGVNPLQHLGVLPETYTLRWTLTNDETGKTWTRTLSVIIPGLTTTYDFACEATFNKVPAGTYSLTLYSTLSLPPYGDYMTWHFTLTEGETGKLWKTSGGPNGEWLDC